MSDSARPVRVPREKARVKAWRCTCPDASSVRVFGPFYCGHCGEEAKPIDLVEAAPHARAVAERIAEALMERGHPNEPGPLHETERACRFAAEFVWSLSDDQLLGGEDG